MTMDKMTSSSMNNSDQVSESENTTVIRPVVLSITTDQTSNARVWNIDDIHITPSPLDTRPRYFQPNSIVDPHVFEQIRPSVYNSADNNPIDNDNDDSDVDEKNQSTLDGRKLDEKILNVEREQELEELSQIISTTFPTNDNLANDILEQLRDVLPHTNDEIDNTTNEKNPTSSIVTSSQCSSSYPPANQTGPISDHDRPYADYGHLEAETIAKEFNFDLECIKPDEVRSSRGPIRMNTKSWAISAWSTVHKETIMTEIKRQFGIEKLQYVCVAHEISEHNQIPHIHLQIILKERANKKTWFLDDITGTHCNYQVTSNDRAWNEYIKKGKDFIEFGSFKSTTVRTGKQWPTPSPSPSPLSVSLDTSSSISMNNAMTVIPTVKRVPINERRHQEKETARQALTLAETSVSDAMNLLQSFMPNQFLSRSHWYLSTFNYIHLRTQQEADRTRPIDKDFAWPISFPDCTPRLHEAMNRWIRHHFSRTKRAKCLIIIGPTGTGKTSFALSLPGRINYYKERWNLDTWNDYARYSVYDDIPWDDFNKLNYPNKKGLLTQNGKINATDKYRGTREICVRQPAIVLLNPEDAGSLLAQPTTTEAHQTANYWKKRAVLYIMESDEYFYKRPTPNHSSQADQSSHSSIGSNEDRLGEPDEFNRMIQNYRAKQSKP